MVKEALAYNAAPMVLAHKHPSGSVEPTRADEFVTQTLKTALGWWMCGCLITWWCLTPMYVRLWSVAFFDGCTACVPCFHQRLVNTLRVSASKLWLRPGPGSKAGLSRC